MMKCHNLLCRNLDFLTIEIKDMAAPSSLWRWKNIDYVLAYADYTDDMSGQFIAMTEVVQPGQEVEVSVQFTAPDKAGEYLSAWSMQNPKGVAFPERIFVKIVVQ